MMPTTIELILFVINDLISICVGRFVCVSGD